MELHRHVRESVAHLERELWRVEVTTSMYSTVIWRVRTSGSPAALPALASWFGNPSSGLKVVTCLNPSAQVLPRPVAVSLP